MARSLANDEQARRPPGDEAHIGKRWGAGWYCESCTAWLRDAQRCPRCGTPHPPWFSDTVAQDSPVIFACGFTWAQDPEIVGGVCRLRADEALIVDEHGPTLCGAQFLGMLRRKVRGAVMDLVGVPHFV